MRLILTAIALLWTHSVHAKVESAGYALKLIRLDDNSCQIVSESTLNQSPFKDGYRIYPAVGSHDSEAPPSHLSSLQLQWRSTDVIEIEATLQASLLQIARPLCSSIIQPSLHPSKSISDSIEIRKLIDSGPSKNRIDVVLMGDGYILSERQKFFTDMQFLVDEMWADTTFASQKPLFNVWAVFVPSKESGIGSGGKPRDTTFGLYRDGTELRGIYCSNPNKAREICRLTGANACDFPSLIANEPYYGGLGGEFTISTSSKTSGTKVLRHEMGHNYIRVGEEYDGGEVYSGVNSDRVLSDLKWKHWLTNPEKAVEVFLIFDLFDVKEKMDLLLEEYPWFDLAKGAKSYTFKSTGKYGRWLLRMSTSGAETSDAIEVYIDDVKLEWKSYFNKDRNFNEWFNTKGGFTAGEHTLTVIGKPMLLKESGPIRQYCSVSLHEYASEPEFHADPNYISAYPTFSINRSKSYRPTNEFCIMRNMTSNSFCPVCKEGMWEQFFKTVSLIDDLKVQCTNSSLTNTQLTATLLKLGQYREGPKIDGEKLVIIWKKDNKIRSEFNGKNTIQIDSLVDFGQWTVNVEFVSLEIRKQRGFKPSRSFTKVEKDQCNTIVSKPAFSLTYYFD